MSRTTPTLLANRPFSVNSEVPNSLEQKALSLHKKLVIFLCILFCYRLAVLTIGEISLFYDEAYYYFWSKDLDWGYYSKPPVVAWLIHASTSLFGDSEWAIKLTSPILYTMSAYIVGLVGAQLYNPRTGFWSAIMFQMAPIVSFNSLFITTDAALVFFWSLTIYLFSLGLEKEKAKYWPLAGVFCGLGLMS